VAQQAMRLLSVPQRFLQLAPVRLLRAIVDTKDDAYHRYLTKSGIFGSLLVAFQQSVVSPALGGNLLVSATLEVLERIRVENHKILVEHVCSKHEALLRQHAPKIRTLHMLLLRHEQNMEYEAFPPEQHTAGSTVPGSPRISMHRAGRQRSPGRSDDSDDDDSYFETLDDDDAEDDASGPSIASPSAVAAEALPQSSESPPNAQDVDAAVAGDEATAVPEVTNDLESNSAIHAVDTEAPGTGALTPDASEPQPTDISSAAAAIAASVTAVATAAPGSPPRSPPQAEAEDLGATTTSEVPNHAPKRQKTAEA